MEFLVSFSEFADCCGFETCAELAGLDCSEDGAGSAVFLSSDDFADSSVSFGSAVFTSFAEPLAKADPPPHWLN